MSTFTISSTFTRPNNTTAYADEDLVSDNTTAASITPLKFTLPAGPSGGKIHRVRLIKSVATATNANFTLYLFGSAPTVTNGDNGAYVSIVADSLASIALDMTTSTTSDDCVVTNSFSVPVIVGPVVYGLLKAEAAYTPGAQEVFTVSLFGEV